MNGSPAPPVRVVVADDALESRRLLQVTLEQWSGIDIVGFAADGVQAVSVCEQQKPDLVLLDLAMPKMDGFEAIARVRAVLPEAKIVALSAFPYTRMQEEATTAGADRYFEKSWTGADLVELIRELFPAAVVELRRK